MNKFIPPSIAAIEEYTPQSDSCEIILDANENPYDLPDEIKKQLADGIESLKFNRYPDPTASPLREKFAKVYGVAAENTVAGNGSDELISVIIGGFLSPEDTVVTVVPDFSMYSFYSSIVGAREKKFVKSADHSIDFDRLSAFVNDNGARMVLFSNPCNPTGKAYSRGELLKFIAATDAIVVVDEAYMEFCKVDCSVIKNAPCLDNLIVLKTLSKAFGLAALRVGFAVSNREMASAINKIRSPYNVNSFSQYAACVVLDNYTLVETRIKDICRNKEIIYKQLVEALCSANVKLSDTDTNFILAKFVDCKISAEEFYRRMLILGIRIRLMKNTVRITVGTADENEKVIAAVKSIVNSMR